VTQKQRKGSKKNRDGEREKRKKSIKLQITYGENGKM
jgi:hypothetical protein